jgi:hypothetical protein
MGGAVGVDAPWAARRSRTEALRARYPFAADMLALYAALLEVQERAYVRALAARPSSPACYAVEHVFSAVVDVTVAHGPAHLAQAVRDRSRWAGAARAVEAWIAGADQSPIDRYLARAAAGPVLEALVHSGRSHTGGGDPGEARRDERHCPSCGGLPQVSYLAPPGDDLVGARRYLVCGRCATSWPYPRTTCAACGERDGARLPVFAEEGTAEVETSGAIVRGLARSARPVPAGGAPKFPHVRVEACETCARYLLAIDLARDPRAVPVVDEMAAVPLDLYVQERGLSKIVPNLMGV